MSRTNYESNSQKDFVHRKLSGIYYYLRPSFHLPASMSLKLTGFATVINALVAIYTRARQIEKIANKEGCELLIGCTGDLYDLPAACMASKRCNIPFISYVFDDYMYQWTGIYRTISKRLEPRILKHAGAIIVPNEYMQAEYTRRYHVSSVVIHNPCLLPDLGAMDKSEKAFESHEISIVYTGAIYHAHYDAFHNLISAIQQLNRSDIKLHVYTAQPDWELKQHGISGNLVVCHTHINNSEVPKILRQANILFLPLAFDSPIPEVIRTSAPGKTGEYLSAGRPILVHAPRDSFISWFFKKNFCGVVVNANDSSLLAEAIKRLISDREMGEKLGRTARKVAEREFSVNRMQKEFLGILNCLEK